LDGKIASMMRIPLKSGSRFVDKFFKIGAAMAATYVLAIILLIVVNLVSGSAPVWQKEGLGFLTGSDWNSEEGRESYGAAPYILGTFVTAGIAMAIGVPISIGIAMFLSELAPKIMRTPLSLIIELLAAVPSVIYGLWGLFVFRLYLQNWVEIPLHNAFGDQSIIFAGAPFG
jgi:phosphate transport system permease protein